MHFNLLHTRCKIRNILKTTPLHTQQPATTRLKCNAKNLDSTFSFYNFAVRNLNQNKNKMKKIQFAALMLITLSPVFNNINSDYNCCKAEEEQKNAKKWSFTLEASTFAHLYEQVSEMLYIHYPEQPMAADITISGFGYYDSYHVHSTSEDAATQYDCSALESGEYTVTISADGMILYAFTFTKE